MSHSLTSNCSTTGKRKGKSKAMNSSEDEANATKKSKPDCCRFNGINNLNKSRIYNFGYRKKPAELFRKDLISAMKMADTEQLSRENYLPITDSWREEWEKGVQVPVNPDNLPVPSVRILREPPSDSHFKLSRKLFKNEKESEPTSSRYELDLLDLCWIENMAEYDNTPQINDNQMEDIINELEHQCARNMKARQVGIEYDDHIICDVCRSPDGEESNEMVFCDLCNICVHQACYGITEIPDGEWLCRPCKEFGSQKTVSCVLCPNLGGALKPTSTANQWAHVSCALWIPEVSIGCVSTMEPITKIKQIPQTRWNLVCSLCNVKQGAPIQCSVKTCKAAYHVICAFNHKLKMKAIVDSDGGKGVKLKSYCIRHTEKGGEEEEKQDVKSNADASHVQHEIEIATHIEEKNEHESDFWKYIDINKVQQEILKLYNNSNTGPPIKENKIYNVIDFVLQYWKMKRTSNYGASLIKLTSSAQFEEQQQQQRNDILRLRVDLERIRNLSYMLCRREKVKRNWMRTHQSAVEKTLSLFTGLGSPDSSPKTVHMSDESSKLVCDVVNCSIIYKYEPNEDKLHVNNIIKTLRRLSKIESLHKHKPNPYAKYYISQLKRKQESEAKSQTASPDQQTKSPLNGDIKNKNKYLNGLTNHKLKCSNGPVNGMHNNKKSDANSSDSDNKMSASNSLSEKKSPLTYRQSPRSLLRPNTTQQKASKDSIKEEKSPSSVPVITRSSLSGYKIPKKKQDYEQTFKIENEIVKSLQNFKRRLEPEYTNLRSPTKNFQKHQTLPVYQSHDNFNYYNSHPQRGEYITRAKLDRRYFNQQQSLLRNVSTRSHSAVADEDALLASAAHDVDMRRHHSSGFRQ